MKPGPLPGKSHSGDELAQLPEKLGGYRIMRMLGRGAMGAVYEAKQISLDRMVALKTIRGRLVNNPATLARFTREAYAAAHLTHHNVVQIYDFGEDEGQHFFSMEWIRGGPLSDLVKEKGAIDPKLSAGYTLQAARGLQFAHNSGMVHRDVKPANLLLTNDGVVKVADLGLVKIPDQMDPESDVGTVSQSGMQSGTQVTMMGTAVGTPAYMAPEQSIDATTVDHRADIYSLGCTLFYLLTGRPPFDGSVSSEVIEQHATQTPPKVTAINTRVPDPLQQIISRSLEKRPSRRYTSLAEMIADLEAFLGVKSEGEFSPSTEQADQWEAIAAQYNSSGPLLKLWMPILVAFTLACGFLTLIVPFFSFSWLLFAPSVFVVGLVAAIGLGPLSAPSAVIRSFRGWIGSLSWLDYFVIPVVAVVLLIAVIASGLIVGFLSGLVFGLILGAVYHFVLVAPAIKAKSMPLVEAERFIRDLRIEGADENGLRHFVSRYSGKSWQGIFEAAFGYISLVKTRGELKGDPSITVSTKSGIRDWLIAKFDNKASINKQARDHASLARIEQRGLQSEGVSPGEARDRAWQMAAAVIDGAQAPVGVAGPTDAAAAQQAKREQMKAMLADARSGKYAKKRDPWAPVRFALSGQTRLLVGCLLLAVFGMWVHSSGIVTAEQIDALKNSVSAGNVDINAVQGEFATAVSTAKETEASTTFMGTGMSGWSIGIAGLLMAMSAFVSGWRMTPFAAVAAVVVLFGPSFGIPGAGPLESWMTSVLAGMAILVPGVIFGEAAVEDA